MREFTPKPDALQADSPPLMCVVCSASFERRSYLLKHQAEEHISAFRCSCGKRFKSQCAVRAHAAALQHSIAIKYLIDSDLN